MSTEMNATETVRKARGAVPCACGTNYQTGNLIYGDTHYHGPDPLADTPEGWWEFGQILEWAQREGHLVATIDGGMSVLGWCHLWLAKQPAQDFRKTFIVALADRLEALAAAIKGEQR